MYILISKESVGNVSALALNTDRTRLEREREREREREPGEQECSARPITGPPSHSFTRSCYAELNRDHSRK